LINLKTVAWLSEGAGGSPPLAALLWGRHGLCCRLWAML